MASLSRIWFLRFFLICLLVSKASTMSRQERKNTNRQRKTTTPAEDMGYPDNHQESSTTSTLMTSTLMTSTLMTSTLMKSSAGEAELFSAKEIPTEFGDVRNTSRSSSKPKGRKHSTTFDGQININMADNHTMSSTSTVPELFSVENSTSSVTSQEAADVVTTSDAVRHHSKRTTDSLYHITVVHRKHFRVRSSPGPSRCTTFAFTSASTTSTSTTSASTTPTTSTVTYSSTMSSPTTLATSATTIGTSVSRLAKQTTSSSRQHRLSPSSGSLDTIPTSLSTTCNSSCELSLCQPVEAETCRGRVVKDRCECCPVCLTEPPKTGGGGGESREDNTGAWNQAVHQNNACKSMNCGRNKVCILNIQGIPMCRCPNIYSCRNYDRNLLCAHNGITYKNKCFLKAEECTSGKRLRILHRGPCRSSGPTTEARSTTTLKPPRLHVYQRMDFDSRNYENTHRKMGRNVHDDGRNAAGENHKTAAFERRPRRRSRHKE